MVFGPGREVTIYGGRLCTGSLTACLFYVAESDIFTASRLG